VLEPKVVGGWLLARQARTLNLDFFVGYSSATGVLASGGQGPYAMANAALDALCHELRSVGVAATSIQWGPWADGCMAASLNNQDAARLGRQGVDPLSSHAALDALSAALITGIPEIAVMAVDWQRFVSVHGASRQGFFSEVAAPLAVPESSSQHDGFIQQYRAAPAAQRRALLSEQIRVLALRSLGLDPQTAVEEARPLKDLGLDSLMAVELRNALARALGCALPATVAFDYPSVEAMTAYLVERLAKDLGETVAPVTGQARTPESVSAVQSLKDMSDDEAEAMLLAELGGRSSGAGELP
jgi:acyl carrier protein